MNIQLLEFAQVNYQYMCLLNWVSDLIPFHSQSMLVCGLSKQGARESRLKRIQTQSFKGKTISFTAVSLAPFNSVYHSRVNTVELRMLNARYLPF